MIGIYVRTCISLLCGAVFVSGAPVIPSLEDGKSYKTHVQMTVYGQEGSVTLFMEEYHDLEERVGRIDFVSGGAAEKHFYFMKPDWAATIEENKLDCEVLKIDSFMAKYDFLPYERSAGVFGPSAKLWTNLTNLIPEDGNFIIRGIPCKKFTYTISDFFENNKYIYYISDPNWKSVHGNAEQTPVRYERFDLNNNQTTMFDFTFFEVGKLDSLASTFLVPLYIGCPNLTVSTSKLLEWTNNEIIYYANEVTDLFAEDNKAESFGKIERTWIDENNRLIKFDAVDEENKYYSNILDFNTGVMYRTDPKGVCDILPIYNATLFEKNYKGSTGQIKSVSEILLLDHDYTYLGEKLHRNIHCDVFEAIENDYTYNNTDYKKVVFTYFVMMRQYKSAASQNDQQLMVALVVTGYNVLGQVTLQTEKDFFDFRSQSYSRAEMSFEKCFSSERRKFFTIYFPVNEDTYAAISKYRDVFLRNVKEEILKVAQISALRLPYLKVYLDGQSATVVGEMIDRPSSLEGFAKAVEASEGPSVGQQMVTADSSMNEELCAMKCEEGTCSAFTFCEAKAAPELPVECYLTPDDMKDSTLKPRAGCQNYNRAVVASNQKEAQLNVALQNVWRAVTETKNFVIKLFDGQVPQKIVATKMEKDVHPFDHFKKPTDKYEERFSGKKLWIDINEIFEVPSEVLSESDCYQKCVDEPKIACNSFSYCPYDKTCQVGFISWKILHDKNPKADSLTTNMVIDTRCTVYERRVMHFFTEHSGLFPISRGDHTYKDATGTGGVDLCATHCVDEKDFFCKGFEICDTDCVLFKKHVIDFDATTSGTSKSYCTYYFLNYTATLKHLGTDIVKNAILTTRTGMSLEECAKMCFDVGDKCRSINYGQKREELSDSICEINSKTAFDPGVTAVESNLMQNYYKDDLYAPTIPPVWMTTTTTTKKPLTDSSGKPITEPSSTEETTGSTEDIGVTKEYIHVRQGVERGTFTGAVIGMLIFGILVGAFGFVGYSYYRSRSRSDDGISVRFTRQT